MKSIWQTGEMYSGRLSIWNRHMIRSVWYVADAKNAWSWRKLIETVLSFYVDSRACVRVGNYVSARFPINIGLRQGCILSRWLFSTSYLGVGYITQTKHLTPNFTSLVSLILKRNPFTKKSSQQNTNVKYRPFNDSTITQ